MIIYFNQVETIAANSEPVYFADSLAYLSTKISLKGNLGGLLLGPDGSGINSNIVTGLHAYSGLLKYSGPVDAAYINYGGGNLGNGIWIGNTSYHNNNANVKILVENITVSEGDWVRNAEYTASLKIYDASDLNSNVYLGIESLSLKSTISHIKDTKCSGMKKELMYDYNFSYDPGVYDLNGYYPQGIPDAFDMFSQESLVRFQREITTVNDKYAGTYSKKMRFFETACSGSGNCQELESSSFNANLSENGDQSSSCSFTIKSSFTGVNDYSNVSPPTAGEAGCADFIIGTLDEFLVKNSYRSKGVMVGFSQSSDGSSVTLGFDYINKSDEDNVENGGDSCSAFTSTKSNWNPKSQESSATVSVQGQASLSNSNCNCTNTQKTCDWESKLESAKSEAQALAVSKAVGGENLGCNGAPVGSRVTELSSYSISVNESKAMSYNVSATATSYIKSSDAPENQDDFTESIKTTDDPPRVEYKNYTFSDGSIARVAYPQLSLGTKTVTITRKYKNPASGFNQVEFPGQPGADTQFILSKTRTKSNDSSSATTTWNYH